MTVLRDTGAGSSTLSPQLNLGLLCCVPLKLKKRQHPWVQSPGLSEVTTDGAHGSAWSQSYSENPRGTQCSQHLDKTSCCVLTAESLPLLPSANTGCTEMQNLRALRPHMLSAQACPQNTALLFRMEPGPYKMAQPPM